MAKHTQTACQQQTKNCLSVFDHFVGFLLKGLTMYTLLTYKIYIDHFSNKLSTNQQYSDYIDGK